VTWDSESTADVALCNAVIPLLSLGTADRTRQPPISPQKNVIPPNLFRPNCHEEFGHIDEHSTQDHNFGILINSRGEKSHYDLLHNTMPLLEEVPQSEHESPPNSLRMQVPPKPVMGVFCQFGCALPEIYLA
jgi:hypothetical protein